MLGYMTEKEAIAHGFTHHGRYYFLPIYICPGHVPFVASKFMALEYVFDLIWWMELNFTMFGEIPNYTVGEPINIDSSTA